MAMKLGSSPRSAQGNAQFFELGNMGTELDIGRHIKPYLKQGACVSDTTFTIFVWFGWANSSLNPVIYAFNADFRKAFSSILGCNKIFPSTTVEAVNFSNELVSYHHDTTLQKEAQPLAAQMPNPREERSLPFDKDSVTSNVSRNHKNMLLPNIGQFECDGEISLDTITPFTSTGLMECEGIPGQIINE
ncbi:hypothetical protein cypCar_00041869 [Cyprinus carpio]|nr:hypothetical protein cypCar_00041869 [Cyprinus carpio]